MNSLSLDLGLPSVFRQNFLFLEMDALLSGVIAVAMTSTPGGAAVYDPSQFNTLWQDSARTIPAVINSVVGAMDDLTGNGHHALQATTANKPFLRGTPQGAELVVNGTFNTDLSGWTIITSGTGVAEWVASNGGELHLIRQPAAGGSGELRTSFPTVIGKVYELKGIVRTSVCNVNVGTAVGLSDLSVNTGNAANGTGSIRAWFTASTTTTHIRIFPPADNLNTTVDNISVKAADTVDVAAPYFLFADGTNDCMQTNAIDLTTVDKVFVCMSAETHFGGSERNVLETSATVQSNAGSFQASTRAGVEGDWAGRVRGDTSASGFRDAGAVLPHKSVYSCQFNLAGADRASEILPRVDGTIPSVLTGLGTSDNDGGNLGSHALNLFSRNQASLFFRGPFYASVVIGRSTVLSAPEIATIEQWAANRSGMVLGAPIANPEAWFKFNTGITEAGTGVSQWSDQSGNGNHLLQGTDANRPTKLAGGEILFNGTSDFLKTAPFALNQPTTIYMRVKQVTWTNNDRLFDGNAVNNGLVYQKDTTNHIAGYAGSIFGEQDVALDTYFSLAVVINGSDPASWVRVGAAAKVTGNSGAGNMSGLTLGAAGDGSLNGNIEVMEMLVYAGAHTDGQNDTVITYLNGL